MPVTYRIDAEGKTIRTKCSGLVTLQQVIEHFQMLKKDPACAGLLDVVLDVSEAESPPESGQLGSIKEELSGIGDQVQFGVCAIVAGRDVMYGMMRVFEVYASPYFRAIRVFRESAEAEAWLASQRVARDAGAKPTSGEHI
jgi:hypothetical protein